MCYLIARYPNQVGCYSIEAERGKDLANLVSSLGKQLLPKNIQILTVSDKEVFGEYKPYRMLPSKEAFIEKAMSM